MSDAKQVPGLIIPRCEVYWGDLRLTGPDTQDIPTLVYDISVSLTDANQTPSGTMSWNPTGRAYKIYEQLVTERYDQTIVVRFFYLPIAGDSVKERSIDFHFLWAGQQESYGNDMSLKVKLASELDGLVNGVIKNTAKADDAGVSLKTYLKDLEKSYGVDGLNLIAFADGIVEKDLEKSKVTAAYSAGTTLLQTLSGAVENNGNVVFAHNIGGAGLVVYPPYTWGEEVKVYEPFQSSGAVDVKVRQGFFLGPAIIDSMQKTSEWQPNQKIQKLTSAIQEKLQPEKDQKKRSRNGNSGGDDKTKTAVERAREEAQQKARRETGATGSTNSRSSSKTRMKDNEDGERKKELIEDEKACKLSATLFMCPALVGIKPHDIIFIPSFDGEYIEDWIVNTVEYSHSDGGVVLSVQASRKYGLGSPMNEKASETWIDRAKSSGLAGEKASLESWVEYGWIKSSRFLKTV